MSKEKTASFNPKEFQEGGGLLDNAEVKWEEVRFVTWDYDGKVPNPVPALKITMKVEDMEEAVEQHYSAGNPQDWSPSKDGTKLMATGKASGINKGSNLGILLMSMVDAGFPVAKMDVDDCTTFEGLECHMVRQKAPERKGLVSTPRADGKSYEKTVLIVDSISKLPWEKKGKGTGGAKKTEEKEEGGVEEEATDIVIALLEENPKGVDKKKLAQLVLGKAKGSGNRNEILKLAYSEEFLNAGPWEYEDGKIKLLT